MNIQLVIRQTDSLKFLNLREATASPHPAGSLPLASLARRERNRNTAGRRSQGTKGHSGSGVVLPTMLSSHLPYPGLQYSI